ncbi:pre-tRNA nuclear export protein [Malassezia sp. CBS 17886]|nr:pre-tRNA nuclear export protein [Malassezia sp. CBS 17886]
MDAQEVQLVQAVDIASQAGAGTDAALVAQALAYLEQLKAATQDSWSTGWTVWAARSDDGTAPKYAPAVRVFGLNLVDDFLEKRVTALPNAAEALSFLQESALVYVQREFVAGSGEAGVAFMKNKFAQTLAQLMLQTYSLTSSYVFLAAVLSLCTAHDPPVAVPPAVPPLNATATDLLLRVLHDLSLSLGSDTTLRAVRGRDRLQRDAVVRDEIRAHHAAGIAELLWRVVRDALTVLADGAAAADAHSVGSGNAAALAQLAMAVVGDFASWIDISLVVNVDTVHILFRALHAQSMALRSTTADTLCEIVAKGMKPADKLALLQALDLDGVLAGLESSTRAMGDEGGVELREHLARLVNALCTELCKIAEDPATADAETRDVAQAKLLVLLPLMLAFFADEYDEPTEQVLSGLHLVLGLYKKDRRQEAAAGAALGAAQSAFIAELITLVLRKMQFDADMDWEDSSLVGGAAADGVDSSEEDDDQLVRFYELRKQLQVLLGAIAAIDEPLVSRTIHTLVATTLAADPATLPWAQAELCLYATFTCGEVLSSVRGNKVGLGPHSYVQLPDEPGKGRGVRQPLAVYQSLPLNTLGETLRTVLTSHIAAHPHPVVQLQYFECIVRYASCFLLWVDQLPGTLAAFLDARGLRNPRAGMRRRINYLFYRFVRETRTAIPTDFVPELLEGMQQAFVVRAQLPAAAPDEDPLAKATERAGAFDAQLYLFDTAGLLMAQLGGSPDTQVMLFKALTAPLTEQLQHAVQAAAADPRDLQLVLQTHHLVLALSTLVKGFPDYDAGRAAEPAWIPAVQPVTEQVFVALTALNRFLIVREAVRGAFARIVTSAGPAVLPYIPTLVNALVHEVTEAELVDLLNFFGLLTNKYKDRVRGVMDDLFTVLILRIFSFLREGVQGTDDLLRRADTERAYFGLVNALLNAGLQDVLVSEKNRAQLQTVLQSLVYYAENGAPATQRAALGVLTRLVALWARRDADTTALPGFEQFLYEAILPLAFQVPSKPSFDATDAQAQLVFTELSALLKTTAQARGDEFAQYLTGVYLPGVQCPPELAMELTQNIQTLDVKPLKRYLESFIAKSRG